MIDSYGRIINYARISITDLCNLRCKYCMPEEGVTKKDCGEILRIEEYIAIAKALTELGVNKIRLSGGEPLVRRGIISLAQGIGKLPGLKSFAITTNGILLPEYADPLKQAGINLVNISLDSLDAGKYKEITRGGDLSRVLNGIQTALNLGFERIKINVVLIKDFNDDEIMDFVSLTKDKPIDVRFIELMPFVGQKEIAYNGFMPGTSVLERCKDLSQVGRDDPSSPALYYKLPGAKGLIGLIQPISHKFCGSCNRLRITADGNILTCLHSRKEVSLKPWLNDPDGLKQAILLAVKDKPASHHLQEGRLMERDMGKIGG